MKHEKTNQQINLPDGRTLGYAEYGAQDGMPVYYFHGFPSSRLDWLLITDENLLTEMGIRIIAPDRPGYGLSDYQRDRKMVDWPEDVINLADALQIDNFAVLGISGGGPYAAACAHGIRDRLTKTGIVSGMGPPMAPGMQDGGSWTIPGTQSIMRRVILKLTAMGIQGDPDKFISRSQETFSEPDKQFLDQPTKAAKFIDGMREAFRQGIKGANQEAEIFTHPWGFDLDHISNEVYLWHGEQDLNVPISVGQFMADKIPGCYSKFYKAEGHFTLANNHLREILAALIE